VGSVASVEVNRYKIEPGADLKGADLISADLRGAKLNYAIGYSP
jgi:uncharacterized protein YjbI with pentapeptide repeats